MIVPTDVPTHTSTISFESDLWRLAGGGLVLFLSSFCNDGPASQLDRCELLLDATDTLLADDDPAAEDDPEARALNKLDGGVVD